MNDFWYFGCKREGEPGHYLFTIYQPSRGMREDDRMGFPVYLLDSTFAPMHRRSGLWRLIVVHGQYGPLTILAGWDNTVDTRPGSNAAFVSHGALTLAAMLERAQQYFPAQYERIVKNPNQPFEVET